MNRFLVVLTAAAVMMVGAPAAHAAAPTPSPGCKGIANAQSKANDKAQPSLAKVADKLGCNPTPPPVDPIACPAGTTDIGTWQATKTSEQGAYPGVYDVDWTLISGSGAADPSGVPTSGGDWFTSSAPVGGWWLTSFTGETVWVPNSGSLQINQNSFVDRTGIAKVRFCSAPTPVDPIACPDGKSDLGTWKATKTSEQGAYPGVYDVDWTLVSGSGVADASAVPTSGGDWFTSSAPVSGWWLRSFTGETVYVPFGGSLLINQASFADRTGIETVRFCG